ncbi:hypothetical protein GCG54_00007118 [Colletotrichum gloeosporioides]|uniref:Uncharacterized protein n=1 Tax=Colletotrichum gloeosporioides TaxID=474922 RepID=A0A8H4FLP3_COLGL|nr:uncharacterized protein GCG54_00007118 [Colletotrichum gloeosporioides]KAF3806868.1 hypothetical protein GCG54_00007118 [Colletotrichum gloeosporioides]
MLNAKTELLRGQDLPLTARGGDIDVATKPEVAGPIQGPFAWPPRFFERQTISKSWENKPWAQCQGADAFNSPEDEISFFLRIDDDSARYQGRVRPILDICSGASLGDLLDGDAPGPLQKMAWLIDGNNSKGFWRSRPCLGALSARQLAAELIKDVSCLKFMLDTCNGYLTDLNRWGILALVRTAPESQARVLGEFFQKHLCARSSIGVSFASEGPEMFTLEFHLPFRVWRITDSLMHDDRVKSSDQEPLRSSRNLTFLVPTSHRSTNGKVHGVYSGHIGCMIMGYDQSRWTAHFAIDTWFDECEDAQDKVMRYQYHVEEGMEVDPLSCGKDDANMPIWHPRAYFLRIMGIRLEQVRDEWELIRQNLHNGIVSFISKQKEILSRIRPFSTGADPEEYGQEFEAFESSLGELKPIVQELSHDLQETLEIGESFLSREVNFFLNYDGYPGDASNCYPFLSEIRRKFNELRQLCIFFKSLEARCVDMMDNSEAARRKVRITFWHCIQLSLWKMLTFLSSLNADDVIPFKKDWRSFLLSNICASVLVFLINKALKLWIQYTSKRPQVEERRITVITRSLLPLHNNPSLATEMRETRTLPNNQQVAQPILRAQTDGSSMTESTGVSRTICGAPAGDLLDQKTSRWGK